MSDDIRYTLTGREAQLAGIAQALEGGAICLFSEQRPARAGDVGHGRMLASCPVSGLVISEGWLRFSMRALGEILGQARWFQARRADGKAILDGTCGRTEGALILPLDIVQPGSPITLTAALTVPENATAS